MGSFGSRPFSKRGETMKKHALAVFVLPFFLVFAGVLASFSSADAAPKKSPIRFQALATLPTDLPGIEKAQYIHFEMDPGAEIKNFKVVSEILWVTQGEFTYKYRNGKLNKKYGNKTVLRKKGESWWQDAGTVIDVSNKGSGVAVIRGVQFIRKKK